VLDPGAKVASSVRRRRVRRSREERRAAGSTLFECAVVLPRGSRRYATLFPDPLDRDTSTLRVERAYKRGLIGTPKGDRARSVAIDSHVLGVLRERRQAQLAAGARSTVVFASGAGTYRRPANVRERGHAQTLADAGLPSSVRLHDLRHTAATLWPPPCASVYFVQQQLGHADLKTTIGTYGHPDQAAHREAAERAAAWWRSG
jgi:integrase